MDVESLRPLTSKKTPGLQELVITVFQILLCRLLALSITCPSRRLHAMLYRNRKYLLLTACLCYFVVLVRQLDVLPGANMGYNRNRLGVVAMDTNSGRGYRRLHGSVADMDNVVEDAAKESKQHAMKGNINRKVGTKRESISDEINNPAPVRVKRDARRGPYESEPGPGADWGRDVAKRHFLSVPDKLLTPEPSDEKSREHSAKRKHKDTTATKNHSKSKPRSHRGPNNVTPAPTLLTPGPLIVNNINNQVKLKKGRRLTKS